VNFLGDRFLRKSHHPFTAIEDLYRHSMDSAFAVTEAFLVTGAPNARTPAACWRNIAAV
jgi:hypothetical protein